MSDSDVTILSLRDRVAAFVREREWERFHNPKDLAAAIAIEAAELMELFLWKGPQDVGRMIDEPDFGGKIAQELADVVILCLSLANQLEIDIANSVAAKIAVNEAKYPSELVRGRANKYTDYPGDI